MDVASDPAHKHRQSVLQEVATEDWSRLVRFAYATVGDRSVAEELVQDAFVRVVRAGARVDDPRAFLWKTLLNVCKSFTLRRSRQPIVTGAAREVAPIEIDETFLALRRLRPLYRTVLALRYYEDLSIESIGSELGIKPGTVKSLVHRALKDLRYELERNSR